MEQDLLNEILKDTYTISDLKKRFLGLKLTVQKKIYQGEKAKESDESEESKDSEVEKHLSLLTQTVSLDSSDSLALEPEIATGSPNARNDEKQLNSSATISEETAKWVRDFNPEMKERITDKNYSEVCALIEGVIDKGTTLAIFFVFIPDVAQVEGFGKWLREHLKNPELLFDVKIDSSLIGGCAISYKGVYRDYSLKARIAANKANLMEEFREYLRR